MSHPSDVRVGGPKRWFQVMVKNTGAGPSPETRLHLHIHGDGDHYYNVPALRPDETFPAHNKRVKRGVRWWHTGRKRCYARVEPVSELRKDNNGIFETLYVYHPSKIKFTPTATIPHPTAIHFKNKHGKFEVNEKERVVFIVQNDSKRDLSETTKFDITIVRHLDNGLRVVVYRKTHLWGQLFPGEKHPIVIDKEFALAGKYGYRATCSVEYPKRKFLHWKPKDTSGSFQVSAQLIEPARSSEQLGKPPKP